MSERRSVPGWMVVVFALVVVAAVGTINSASANIQSVERYAATSMGAVSAMPIAGAAMCGYLMFPLLSDPEARPFFNISFTTCPSTSVRRKFRPACLKVSLVWSMPSW